MENEVLGGILYVVSIILVVYWVFALWKLHMTIKKYELMLKELLEGMDDGK